MIRFVTANAASGRDGRGGHDVRAWSRALATLDADVVAVQEVDHRLPRSGGERQTEVVREALATAYGGEVVARFCAAVTGDPSQLRRLEPGTDEPDPAPSYGIALLSRHPVAAWRTLRLAPSAARLPVALPPGSPARVVWAPDEHRAALAATLDTPDGPLTVVGTHLSFSPPRAVGQLREVVAWAADLPGPVVLLGDLNLPGGVPAWLSGWRAGARHATYPAHRPRAQLDHVLLAEPARTRVLAHRAEVLAHSDHLALVVDLSLRAR